MTSSQNARKGTDLKDDCTLLWCSREIKKILVVLRCFKAVNAEEHVFQSYVQLCSVTNFSHKLFLARNFGSAVAQTACFSWEYRRQRIIHPNKVYIVRAAAASMRLALLLAVFAVGLHFATAQATCDPNTQKVCGKTCCAITQTCTSLLGLADLCLLG